MMSFSHPAVVFPRLFAGLIIQIIIFIPIICNLFFPNHVEFYTQTSARKVKMNPIHHQKSHSTGTMVSHEPPLLTSTDSFSSTAPDTYGDFLGIYNSPSARSSSKRFMSASHNRGTSRVFRNGRWQDLDEEKTEAQRETEAADWSRIEEEYFQSEICMQQVFETSSSGRSSSRTSSLTDSTGTTSEEPSHPKTFNVYSSAFRRQLHLTPITARNYLLGLEQIFLRNYCETASAWPNDGDFARLALLMFVYARQQCVIKSKLPDLLKLEMKTPERVLSVRPEDIVTAVLDEVKEVIVKTRVSYTAFGDWVQKSKWNDFLRFDYNGSKIDQFMPFDVFRRSSTLSGRGSASSSEKLDLTSSKLDFIASYEEYFNTAKTNAGWGRRRQAGCCVIS